MELGGYRILDEIGRGGMGIVYRGVAPDGRPVAVKVLRDPSGGSLARFDRERRLLSELGEGDGFVPLRDAGAGPHGPFVVMPFFGGGSLRARLESERRLEVDAVVALGRALAAALARAHHRGIIHRDLKPDNVIFTDDGRPLITDMGLAKHFREGESLAPALSSSGELRGTLGYLAPEQMRDAKTAGPPADVHALGAMLYECLTGRTPFWAESPAQLLVVAMRADVEPVRRHRPDAPDWLERVVLGAVARLPEERPTARALHAALEASGARAPRAVGLSGRRGSGPALVAALAGALLVVAVVVAIVLGAGSGPEAPPAAAPSSSAALAEPPPAPSPERPPSPDPSSPEPEPEPDSSRALAAHRRLVGSDRVRLLGVLGDAPPGAEGAVTGLAARPESREVIAVDEAGLIRAWDVDDGGSRVIARLDAPATHVVVSPSGLVAGVADRGGMVWTVDLERGVAERLVGIEGAATRRVTSLAIADDGTRMLVGISDGTISILDLAPHEVAGELVDDSGRAIHALAFLAEDRRRAVVAGWGGTLTVVDLDAGRERGPGLALPGDQVTAVARAHDGEFILAGSRLGQVAMLGVDPVRVLVDLVGGGPSERAHTAAVTCLTVTGGGVLASASIDGTVRFWGPRDGRPEERGALDLSSVADVPTAICSQGETIVVGTRAGAVLLLEARE